MDAVVLDTDVFSFFFRPDTRRELYVADLAGRQLCLSFQSVAELHRWAIERNWSDKRRRSLEEVMHHYLVLPFDADMARRWVEIVAARNRGGLPIACGDAWIAASASRHGLPLVSHNGGHFLNIPGLQVICHAPGFPPLIS